jgi:lipopolysaccharide heptosyltransferase II
MFKKYVFVEKKNLVITSLIDLIGSILFFWVRKDKPLGDIKNILVIRVDHIGDVITTVPSLRALRKAFPKANISVMVRSLSKDLLVNCPYINEIIVYDAPWFHGKKSLNLFKTLSFLRRLREKNFDLAIDFKADLRNICLAYLSRSRNRLAYDVKGGGFLLTHIANYRRGLIHNVDRSLEVLKKIGIEAKDKSLELWIPESVKKKVKLPNKKFIVIHPGSGGPLKLWSNEGFAQVGDYIIKKYKAEVVLTGSPDEAYLANDIERFMSFKPLNLAGKTSLLELAEIIRRAKIFISPDSGPMHMAVAVKTPTIELFGTSLSEVWGYKSKNDMLIERKGKDLSGITPEEVMKAVDKLWRKR